MADGDEHSQEQLQGDADEVDGALAFDGKGFAADGLDADQGEAAAVEHGPGKKIEEEKLSADQAGQEKNDLGPLAGGLADHVDDADGSGDFESFFGSRSVGEQAGEEHDGVYSPAHAAAQSLERWAGRQVDIDGDAQRAFVVRVSDARHRGNPEQAAVAFDAEADFGSGLGANDLAEIGWQRDFDPIDLTDDVADSQSGGGGGDASVRGGAARQQASAVRTLLSRTAIARPIELAEVGQWEARANAGGADD